MVVAAIAAGTKNGCKENSFKSNEFVLDYFYGKVSFYKHDNKNSLSIHVNILFSLQFEVEIVI